MNDKEARTCPNHPASTRCGLYTPPDSPPQVALLTRARAGDLEAQSLLVAPHIPPLWAYATRLCGDPVAAQDHCQDALLKALAKLWAFPDDGDLHLWLRAFVRHHLKDFRKKSGTTPLKISIVFIEDMIDENINDAPEGLADLPELVALATAVMPQAWRCTAKAMIDYFWCRGELPSVSALAGLVGKTHSSAQRSREYVLASWRRAIIAQGLHP